MTQIPLEHVKDSHELIADGLIELFELTPAGGTGIVRFKNDNDVTWRGNAYSGLPVAMSGAKKSADNGRSMPKLVIGQPNVDLSAFKPLINDGWLDNAVVVKYTVLLTNLLSNANIKETEVFRVKRVEQYSKTQVTMQLATLSDSLGFQMPYRTFLPPAFPSVQM